MSKKLPNTFINNSPNQLIILLLLLIIYPTSLYSEDYSLRETELFKQIKCPICQGQSIIDSGADMAISIKAIVSQQIKKGKSDREIKKYLVERYGQEVLFSPPFELSTAFLWFAPFLILVIGALVINTILIKQKRYK